MEYRLYTFVNYYLSDIQRGIQTAHVVHDMFTKYIYDTYIYDNDDCRVYMDTLLEWSQNWKTIIVLNGGNSKQLGDLVNFITKSNNTLPYDYFHEGEDSLDGALTAVGIVLPEHVFKYQEKIFKLSGSELDSFNDGGHLKIEDEIIQFTEFEKEMAKKLVGYRLA